MLASSIAQPGTFQSTLPVWGVTGSPVKGAGKDKISIHTPRVGSDLDLAHDLRVADISIHTPRVGSDTLSRPVGWYTALFQSTLPVWGVTRQNI